MLVLSRQIDEKVCIIVEVPGTGLLTVVVVQVVEIPGGWKARLGFGAPKKIPIHREEVFDEVIEEAVLLDLLREGCTEESRQSPDFEAALKERHRQACSEEGRQSEEFEPYWIRVRQLLTRVEKDACIKQYALALAAKLDPAPYVAAAKALGAA